MIFVGIRPEQITQETLVWHVGRSSDFAELVELVKVRTQTTMHAQNLVINQSGNWQAVEHVNELLPDFDRESSLAVVVESVHSVNLGDLMVTSEQEEVFRVLDLEGEEQTESLDGVLSAVNIVSQEEIVSFRRHATKFKQFQKVMELSVQVTTNLDRSFQFKEHGLVHENFSSLSQETDDFGL